MAVEREFHKIFQMLIEKGANLVYENENIMHIIMKKKFKKAAKKKKFLRELTNRPYLLQADSQGRLPIDYEDSDEIKIYCM